MTGDEPPVDAPILEINMEYINEYLVIVACVVSCVGVLGTTACIIFNVTYRNAT